MPTQNSDLNVRNIYWNSLIFGYWESISSVIRQKGESQNACFKKSKHTKFSKNEHSLSPDTFTVCVSGDKKCSFLGIFENIRFEICPFSLLPANCSLKIRMSEHSPPKIINDMSDLKKFLPSNLLLTDASEKS